jgi:cytochrome c-type biogenesis protein CcmH/NrfG
MHPDDEPEWKAAFAELQRRQRQDAPAARPMLERALRDARHADSGRGIWWLPRVAWACAVCALAVAIWWSGERWSDQTARQNADRGNPSATTETEQVLAEIERHLEAADPALKYPTDLLLVGNSDPSE